jgi:ribosome maturation factor RimP
VSSAGLDKPLRHINQYIKNVGRRIEVILKNGQKLEGEIIKVSDTGVVIMDKVLKPVENKKKKELVEEVSELLFDDVKETRIVVSFK